MLISVGSFWRNSKVVCDTCDTFGDWCDCSACIWPSQCQPSWTLLDAVHSARGADSGRDAVRHHWLPYFLAKYHSLLLPLTWLSKHYLSLHARHVRGAHTTAQRKWRTDSAALRPGAWGTQSVFRGEQRRARNAMYQNGQVGDARRTLTRLRSRPGSSGVFKYQQLPAPSDISLTSTCSYAFSHWGKKIKMCKNADRDVVQV